MLNREGDTYLYLQISEVLRSRITAELAPGDLVISEAEIQREFKVARTTARRAIRVLRNQGLVHTRQGEGTFVNVPGQSGPLGRRAPFYRHIAGEIRERIRRHELVSRQQIPSEVELVREYGAARETVRRAIALLREEGWVYSVPHRGSFVAPQEQWPV
ncbi:DNA-binding GntR family transcriptional regulator [Nonomuraea thailandensis]|uniref:DNA-binding GntR family transcriptional regulator n=1 Tax=Nonomuraea thailandensis TaxID=1188745 RepID=A0A9X2GU42_9ACTN|nr:GntR family transcriptional regulator [Nonomuraea thailandensis]MCP2360903.1 DNA-binding GntR family transcriptional regulator [Nonomuraea thailandensis]